MFYAAKILIINNIQKKYSTFSGEYFVISATFSGEYFVISATFSGEYYAVFATFSGECFAILATFSGEQKRADLSALINFMF